MGLQNSAQSFQRLVDSVLRGVSNCYVYLDDILIFNKNEAEHLKTIEEVYKRLDKAGLTLVLDKCEFGKSQVEYLGYTVDSQGIRPLQRKLQALYDFKQPQSQKDLLHFLLLVKTAYITRLSFMNL